MPLAVWRAHQHRVADHGRIMISIFLGALVVAELFTLVPGRIMHAVLFGNNRPRTGRSMAAFSASKKARQTRFQPLCSPTPRETRKSLEKRG